MTGITLLSPDPSTLPLSSSSLARLRKDIRGTLYKCKLNKRRVKIFMQMIHPKTQARGITLEVFIRRSLVISGTL